MPQDNWARIASASAKMRDALYGMAIQCKDILRYTNTESMDYLLVDTMNLLEKHRGVRNAHIHGEMQRPAQEWQLMLEARNDMQRAFDKLMDTHCPNRTAFNMRPCKDMTHPDADVIDLLKELEFCIVSLGVHVDEISSKFNKTQ